MEESNKAFNFATLQAFGVKVKLLPQISTC